MECIVKSIYNSCEKLFKYKSKNTEHYNKQAKKALNTNVYHYKLLNSCTLFTQ